MVSINLTSYWIPESITFTLGAVLSYKLYQRAMVVFADLAVKDKLLKDMTQNNNALQNENRDLRRQLNKKEDSLLNIEHEKLQLTQSKIFLYKERRSLLLSNVDKTRYVYNRFHLHKNYLAANLNNSCRMKSLKIVQFPDFKNPKILACLYKWLSISKDMLKTTVSLQTRSRLGAIRDIITFMNINNKNDCIAAAVDDSDEIHAICISSDDHVHNAAYKIEYLVSSPLNLKDNGKQKVEGAGTALIQHVIEKALLKQNLPLNKPIEIVSGEVAVTVYTIPDAASFYRHVGFVDYKPAVGSSENMILIGDKLVDFLKKYGGRCSI